MGKPYRRCPSPKGYGCMVPLKQHRRNAVSAELLRPRVVRVLPLASKNMRKNLLLSGCILSKDSGQLPRHGINEHHRRKFPASENIIADGDFLIDPSTIDHPLINPLIVSAEKKEPRLFRKFLHLYLRKSLPARTQVYPKRSSSVFFHAVFHDSFHSRNYHIGPHHHPHSSSIGTVVHLFALSLPPLAKIMEMYLHWFIILPVPQSPQ